MKYKSGKEIRLGDKVKLGDSVGEVVCIIEDGVFTDSFPKSDWEYLKKGILVEFQTYGLIHYIEPEDDLSLVQRKEKN